MSRNGRTTEESIAKKRRLDTPKAVDSDFVRPSDWPAAGEAVDLAVQDLPHDSANTEWWYLNGHLKTEEGKDVSFFASFFRVAADGEGKDSHAHALTWALVDVGNSKYYADPILDIKTPQILKKQLEDGSYEIDSRMKTALLEVVNKGNVPLPDRVFTERAEVSKDRLSLNYQGQTFSKDEKGHYHLHCHNANKSNSITLSFAPKKKPVLQGHEGVVKVGIKGETMFYYFIPRNECVGTVVIEGKEHKVRGEGWYDHEFGGAKKDGKKEEKEKKDDYAWNWLSLQLEDGTDLTATNLVQANTKEVFDNFVVVIGPKNERFETEDMELKPANNWVSVRTTHDYPTHWTLKSKDAQLDLTLEAAFPTQEVITLIAKPGFWEGRMHASGTYKGKKVKGVGFIERHGFQTISSLDFFFKKVSKLVLECIAFVLPHNPTYEQVRLLLANEEYDHYMSGVDLNVFGNTIIKPLRDIVDRGGKSWRSFALLLCIDCVGGDSHKFKMWLAMPEIMHVGSLIVDDIQDKSDTRRGGPSCHLMYGEPIAINAGTAGYFLSLDVIQNLTHGISDSLRLKMYELYFLTLRAGHSGQAFDINGLDYLMPEAVKTGSSEKLEKSVLCTHRLKSAVPAGNLARMGGHIGGGTNEQIWNLGMYFESIGLAFQIIDDVLNLRGFKGNTKARGEDIVAGKITFPVAKAMSRLDAKDREWVWETIKSKPQDQKVVESVIDKLEQCGAITASVDHATNLVDDAWATLDKLIPDSFYKLLLRAFGIYVLERHY